MLLTFYFYRLIFSVFTIQNFLIHTGSEAMESGNGKAAD